MHHFDQCDEARRLSTRTFLCCKCKMRFQFHIVFVQMSNDAPNTIRVTTPARTRMLASRIFRPLTDLIINGSPPMCIDRHVCVSHVAVVAVALTCLIVSSIALAVETKNSVDFSACMDKSGGVTSEMLDCISAETKRQDVRLNNAYKRAGARLSVQRKRQLLDAQRAWIKYRDANCTFYAFEGGTLAAVISNSCFMSATTDRAQELEHIADE